MRSDKIKELYENQIDTINVEYEIIDVANETPMVLMDVVYETNDNEVRYKLGELIIGEYKNIYIIEKQEHRGALYVSTNHEEVLKEWFILSYIKEQER